MRTTKLASVALLLGTVACQSGDPATPPEPAPEAAPEGPLCAEPPIDLGGSVPAAALALTFDGAAYRGGYLTHQVTLVDDIVDVTPWHRDPRTGQRRR